MLRGEYAVFTPAISRFGETIAEWIDNQVPGAYFYGVPRLGKSRAVKFWIERLLQERYDNSLPFFRWIRRHHQQISENEFWAELLQSLRNRYWESGKRHQKLNRLLMQFRTRADRCNTNCIVLMIDEAQTMGPMEWRWLVNLQNLLDDAGYRLTIFSVGSHELTYQHDSFELGGDAHLTARFMVQSARFHGIRSIAELHYVLRAYDEDSEWPEGTGISYTRYFAEQAFLDGFRLANCAEFLWSILVDLAPHSNRRRITEFPMQHIARTCEFILRQAAKGIPVECLVNDDEMRRAVQQTGFREHMRMIYPLRKEYPE